MFLLKVGRMKAYLVSACLVVWFVFSGCDPLRKLAGRPTSKEIETKREAIVRADSMAHAARMDSLHAIEKELSDSLAALDSAVQTALQMGKSGLQERGTVLNPAKLGGLFGTKLDYRYYVVVGAFAARSNAEKLLSTVNGAGYTATLISFRNGLTAVGACQTDNLNYAFKCLDKIREESFCPPDAWILVNE